MNAKYTRISYTKTFFVKFFWREFIMGTVRTSVSRCCGNEDSKGSNMQMRQNMAREDYYIRNNGHRSSTSFTSLTGGIGTAPKMGELAKEQSLDGWSSGADDGWDTDPTNATTPNLQYKQNSLITKVSLRNMKSLEAREAEMMAEMEHLSSLSQGHFSIPSADTTLSTPSPTPYDINNAT